MNRSTALAAFGPERVECSRHGVPSRRRAMAARLSLTERASKGEYLCGGVQEGGGGLARAQSDGPRDLGMSCASALISSRGESNKLATRRSAKGGETSEIWAHDAVCVGCLSHKRDSSSSSFVLPERRHVCMSAVRARASPAVRKQRACGMGSSRCGDAARAGSGTVPAWSSNARGGLCRLGGSEQAHPDMCFSHRGQRVGV